MRQSDTFIPNEDFYLTVLARVDCTANLLFGSRFSYFLQPERLQQPRTGHLCLLRVRNNLDVKRPLRTQIAQSLYRAVIVMAEHGVTS